MMRVARIIFISRVNRIALTATPAPELLSDSNIEAKRLNGIALIKSGKNHPRMYIPAGKGELS